MMLSADGSGEIFGRMDLPALALQAFIIYEDIATLVADFMLDCCCAMEYVV